MREEEFDFFISHASEDKDSFVRPLVDGLIAKGYRVWYDEMSLNIGDSLVESISNGIKKSLYGIIILSKNFCKKKWTKKEMTTLISKEIITDQNLILPIWLDLTAEDVFDFSPILADKLSLVASRENISFIIEKIEQLFKIENTSVELIKQKISYLTSCNEDRRNKYYLDLEKRIRSIFLYQQEYYNWYTSTETFNDSASWNDLLVSKKERELMIEYSIPQGVWTNPEPFSWNEIERAIKLCSKWIFRKLTYKEAIELYFLLDEILDTDVHYVLYGFPYSTIRDNNTYEESINGIFEIGIKNPSKRIGNEKKHSDALNTIFEKLYS
jgi:hypothetical protein